MSNAAFRIELFGAPRVLQRGAEVRLPVRKSLALLAYLTIEGRATRAKLAALFWGESGDEAARRNLRRELHRLREAGLAELLVVDDAVVSSVSGLPSDVAEFDSVAEQDAATAIALYRGPLLDGFEVDAADEFEAWLAGQRERYAARWAQFAAAEAARLTAHGDARAALALHLRLIEADALQEAQFVAAMRLYNQLGERSRALDLYERCRATLQRELGLDPLPETAALAERIRAAEQLAPLVAQRSLSGFVPGEVPLIAREAELQHLREAATAVLIVGEPGVGKSRLAQSFCAEFGPALTIANSELGRGTALHALAEALQQALGIEPMTARLASLPAGIRTELARLLPGLAAEPPRAEPDSPAAARARFFEAMTTALLALAGGGAILIDDLHWADEATLDLIDQLVHRAGQNPQAAPRIVLAARRQELADHARAGELALKLERAGLLQRMPLAAFDAEATLKLVRALSGSRRGTLFAARLQRATQGNPFFLLETIRFLFDSGELALDERGVWTTRYDDATSTYVELPVPPTVQQAVLERVERLGPGTRRVLETAALAGQGFALDEVQPATALSDWEALEGLERALLANVLVRTGPGYRFAHDLVRTALDSRIGPERRRLVHLKLGDTLESRRGDADRIALHFESAGAAPRAVAWRRRAAEAAERVFARHDALAHLERALLDGAQGPEEIDIRLDRVRLQWMLNLHDARAAELAVLDRLTAGGGDAAARYRALVQQALLKIDQGQLPEALRQIEAAFAFPAPTDWEGVEALRFAGATAVLLGDDETAERHLKQAVALAKASEPDERLTRQIARCNLYLSHLYICIGRGAHALAAADDGLLACRADDAVTRAALLNASFHANDILGRRQVAIDQLAESISLFGKANAVAMLAAGHANGVVLSFNMGDAEAARRHYEALTAGFGTAENPHKRALVLVSAGRLAVLEGRLGDALDAFGEVRTIAESMADSTIDRESHLLRARLFAALHMHQRAIEEADAAIALMANTAGRVLLLREAVLAAGEIADGQPGAARRRLETALASPALSDPAFSENREFAWNVLARACIDQGDFAAAVGAVRDVRVEAAQAALAIDARMRAAVGRAHGETAAFDEARRFLAAGHVPPLEAVLLRKSLARCLSQAGRDGDAGLHRNLACGEARRLIESLDDRPDEQRSLAHLHEDLMTP